MNHYNLRPRVQSIEPVKPKNDDKCAICLEQLSYNNRKTYTTDCGHTFHTMCFNKLPKETCECCNILMILRVNCPYCRTRTTFEPKYRLILCKKNLQNIQYAILCEEMKLLQMFDYSSIKFQLLNLKKQLKTHLKILTKCKKKDDDIIKVIEGTKILIQIYEDEKKNIFDIIKNSTQTFRFHEEKIKSHIQALNDILRPSV